MWQITSEENKKVFNEVNCKDPILSLYGVEMAKLLRNISVDGVGNVWMTSSLNGHCYVVSKDNPARVVYLNKQISVDVNVEDKAVGVVWDSENSRLVIITCGPNASSSKSEVTNNIAYLIPSTENFAKEVKTYDNDWNLDPLYIRNEGIPINKPGVGLIQGENTPLYFIGEDQLYLVNQNGDIERFGKKFEGLLLKGGTVDDSGNLYISANSLGDEKGVIYKIDKKGRH